MGRARDVRPVGRQSQESPTPARPAAGRRVARRGPDLPLPLLLLLAVGAVLGERLGPGRRPLLVVLPLALCLALSAFGVRFIGRGGAVATPTPPAPVAAIATAPAPTATAAATAAPPTAPPPPRAAGTTPTPSAPPASGFPAPTATATPAPSIAPTPTGAGLKPVVGVAVESPTAGPPPVPPTPRGTTVIPILMYHYIRVVTDPKDTIGINLSVPPPNFAAQMQYLADNGYTTLTMREVQAILAGTMPLPAKPIALTFDDGYRDFYTAAWPVLKRHNFKATSYVVSDFIDQELYMTWPMIQELDRSGLVEIGSHTRNHVDLRALGKERRWDEISGSKAALEAGLGHPIVSFCYPSGFYNADVAADVKRAGYLTAVTTAYGSKLNLANAFELPRVRVNGPDPLAAWVSKLP